MNEMWIIDFKSSSGVFDEYKTQVSCYAMMQPEKVRAGILRLDKETGLLDDPAVVEVTDIEARWQAFLGLREYYRHILEPKAKQDRWYKDGDKKYPTITTILGCLDKPALVQWAANMTVEYFKENAKEMTTPEQIEYHLKKAKTAYRTMSKKAMDTGSIVHDAIHAYLSGAKPEPILGDNDKAQNSFLAFLQWADKVKLKPVALEKVLIDPEHQVGGTCDFIGWAEI
jgi:hypothetical protein